MSTTRKIIAITFLPIALVLGAVVAKPRPTIADLDLKHAHDKNLTAAQKKQLLDSFLAGNPTPVGKNVCCCQPGWQVYDSSDYRCSRGKLIDKHISQ